MIETATLSFAQWYCEGRHATFVRTMKSPGGLLDLVEMARPAGDMSRPGVSDLVLYEDMRGGTRVSGDLGGGWFDTMGRRGSLALARPDFATTANMEGSHQLRSLAFPVGQWRDVLDEASNGAFAFDRLDIYGRMFDAPVIRAKLRSLWALSEEEGAPSRLLARAAGCEILAELCQMNGTPFARVRGGLAPWAQRRCLELMRDRLAEDIGLDELAAEAQLSPYHFARMFKQSLGCAPRAYLTRLRLDRACELLEHTDLPVTEIALQVGYSSNQVLARVFLKHRHRTPTDHRRATRAAIRAIPEA